MVALNSLQEELSAVQPPAGLASYVSGYLTSFFNFLFLCLEVVVSFCLCLFSIVEIAPKVVFSLAY